MLCDTSRKLPVTIKEIRIKAKTDKYVTKKKKEINDQQYKEKDGEKIFFLFVMEFWCTVNVWWCQEI